MTTIKSWLAFK